MEAYRKSYKYLLRMPCRFREKNSNIYWTRRNPRQNSVNKKPVQVSAGGPNANYYGGSAIERSGRFSGVMSRADVAVGHSVKDVEAIRQSKIVAPIDGGWKHDIINGLATLKGACSIKIYIDPAPNSSSND